MFGGPANGGTRTDSECALHTLVFVMLASTVRVSVLQIPRSHRPSDRALRCDRNLGDKVDLREKRTTSINRGFLEQPCRTARRNIFDDRSTVKDEVGLFRGRRPELSRCRVDCRVCALRATTTESPQVYLVASQRDRHRLSTRSLPLRPVYGIRVRQQGTEDM